MDFPVPPPRSPPAPPPRRTLSNRTPAAGYSSLPQESMSAAPTTPTDVAEDSSVRRRASIFGPLTKAKTVRDIEKEAAKDARHAWKQRHESETLRKVIPADDWERWVGKVDVIKG